MWLDLWHSVQIYDDQLFVKINQVWVTSELSVFFSFITNLHKTEVFMYVIAPLLIVCWWLKARSQMFAALLAMGLLILVADTICYRGLKSVTQRDRPFLDTSLNAEVRVPYKPQSSSFPSNHAVNCFAVATLLTWYYPPLTWIFYLIAALVGYSRIYVGVHYPSDILVGAIIGILIAASIIRIYDKIEPLKPQHRVKTKRAGLRSVARK